MGSSVSIRTPVQGVTVSQLAQTVAKLGFNPHARAGRDNSQARANLGRIVSIRTPVQGVTAVDDRHHQRRVVSIRTPVQGVTRADEHCVVMPGFQSARPCRA